MATIGYIYADGKLIDEDKIFLRAAREIGARVVLFPAAKFLTPGRIKWLAKKCDIILNNSAEPEALEIAKAAELAGTQIIDPTEALYFFENKWMFYLHCQKYRIPTPKTFLLPQSISQCYKPIKKLLAKNGSVVIKNVMGSNGKFVDRAKNLKQAIEIIKKFRKKDCSSLVAQEYLKESHKVYRVMVIGGKVVQGVIKKSKSWKCTGSFLQEAAPSFKVGPKLNKLCVKISRVMKIPWCGIDLMRKGGKWVAIEANSSPGMDFSGNWFPAQIAETRALYKILIEYILSKKK